MFSENIFFNNLKKNYKKALKNGKNHLLTMNKVLLLIPLSGRFVRPDLFVRWWASRAYLQLSVYYNQLLYSPNEFIDFLSIYITYLYK